MLTNSLPFQHFDQIELTLENFAMPFVVTLVTALRKKMTLHKHTNLTGSTEEPPEDKVIGCHPC